MAKKQTKNAPALEAGATVATDGPQILEWPAPDDKERTVTGRMPGKVPYTVTAGGYPLDNNAHTIRIDVARQITTLTVLEPAPKGEEE